MKTGFKMRDTRHQDVLLTENAWPIGRLVFASSLSIGLMVLFLLVPPTTVRADRSTLADTRVNENPVTATADLIADASYSYQPINQNSIAAGFSVVEAADGLANIQLPATKTAEEKINWKTVKVNNGDTLTHVFKRVGLEAKDAYELLGRCPEAKSLSRIHPGHELDFDIRNNQLNSLRHKKSVLESQIYSRQDDIFVANTVLREPQRRVRYQKAALEDSLFLAAKRVGLEHNVIMQLANVFGGVVDFVLDPRKGDTFNIMYEDLYLDGEKIGSGDILAAEYVNDGESFVAYRYEDKKGRSGYYAPDGVSMQKAFLRAPLDFKRISSNFNPRRRHPIHKSIRAHRGIDYAAPRGTPVFSAGDGRVVQAGYSRANGNFVVVSHGPQYTTKYLHLTKRHTKKSARVKKGQMIGTVGSTGYATGPHLHYEFLVNGVHRNPRTIVNKLPKAKSIAKAEMPRFRDSISDLQEDLAKHQNAYQLVELDTSSYSVLEPQDANAGH